MGNYKPWAHTAISGGGIVKPQQHDLITLSVQGGLLTTVFSLLQDSTNIQYVVPSGKTFNLIMAICNVSAVGGKGIFWQGATDGAKTILKWRIANPTIGGQFIHYSMPPITFAEDTYVTYDPTVANMEGIVAVGYET